MRVKRRRWAVRLTYRQQLILALLLVILLATSMLYCLGFSSLLLGQVLDSGALPQNGLEMPGEYLDLMPTVLPATPGPQPTVQP